VVIAITATPNHQDDPNWANSCTTFEVDGRLMTWWVGVERKCVSSGRTNPKQTEKENNEKPANQFSRKNGH